MSDHEIIMSNLNCNSCGCSHFLVKEKYFQVYLNPMRSNAEVITKVGPDFNTKDDAILWIESQRHPEGGWSDTDHSNPFFPGEKWSWNKVFKKDSELEWFNPPASYEESIFRDGIFERERYVLK